MIPGLSVMMRQSDAGSGGGFVSGLTVTTFPTSVSRTISFSDGANHTATTASVIATASGGSGSYTYAWARVSGSSAITATSPATDTTAFTATLSPNDILHATFRVTATDTGTGATATADEDVTLHYVDLR